MHPLRGWKPYLSRERRERVRSELDKLPPEQRQVLEMAFYQGLSQSEIAAKADLPSGDGQDADAPGDEKTTQRAARRDPATVPVSLEQHETSFGRPDDPGGPRGAGAVERLGRRRVPPRRDLRVRYARAALHRGARADPLRARAGGALARACARASWRIIQGDETQPARRAGPRGVRGICGLRGARVHHRRPRPRYRRGHTGPRRCPVAPLPGDARPAARPEHCRAPCAEPLAFGSCGGPGLPDARSLRLALSSGGRAAPDHRAARGAAHRGARPDRRGGGRVPEDSGGFARHAAEVRARDLPCRRGQPHASRG